MKTRMFYATLAIVVMSAMSSACSKDKEEDTSLKFDLKVEFPEMDRSSAKTKASRLDWLKDDKIVLFFNKKLADNQQAEIVYDGRSWNVKFMGSEYMDSLPESGTLDAIYFEGGDLQMKLDMGGFSKTVSNCENKVRLQAENVPYQIKGGVLSAKVQMQYYMDLVMVTVRGINPSEGWSFYAGPSGGVVEEPFNHIPGAYVSPVKIGAVSSKPINQKNLIPLLANPDGGAAYMEIWNEAYGQVEEYIFHLRKGTEEYVKTFHHKIISPCEIIFDGPGKGNENGWQQVK